ncbi:metallophosphoesterase [Neobacillus sp. PS3-40]|uniref:metallophosphoesterase family protein n=1 Tax=Neobacillus sp. PS3-40 TaxID=3070679 RepID=UPI0027E1D6DA|nr:metallophosphoesterase [Neobacillus sp. PS3-40]WML45581.1 metallophosphoesterase [Neobacillus sp. PS3-40]
MSKILVVSDSHGLTSELEVLKKRHQHEVEMMIHCGDSQLMNGHMAISGFVTVLGNCDFGGYPLETIVEIAGRKIFVTHGHKYSIKASLMTLNYRAKEVKADIVCFGHSHVVGAEMIEGTLFLNPGSLRLPRERLEKTYMILDLQDEKMKLSIFEMKGKELVDLSYEYMVPNSKR